jgi:hypothetical protein
MGGGGWAGMETWIALRLFKRPKEKRLVGDSGREVALVLWRLSWLAWLWRMQWCWCSASWRRRPSWLSSWCLDAMDWDDEERWVRGRWASKHDCSRFQIPGNGVQLSVFFDIQSCEWMCRMFLSISDMILLLISEIDMERNSYGFLCRYLSKFVCR